MANNVNLDHIPPQIKRMLERREKLARGISKEQREMDALIRKINLDQAKLDPQLRDIETKIFAKEIIDFKCPNCGDSTRGNRMNGVPWCFKCNQSVKSNMKSRRGPTIRVVSKDESLRRCLKELTPDFL
jgi:ribosomal protein L37AE/L43A